MFLGQSKAIEYGRLDWARRDRVYANIPAGKVRGYAANKRAHSSLGGSVGDARRITDVAGHAGVEDDRRAIVQVRKRFLNGEERTLGVDVKKFVIRGFGESAERSEFGDAGVYKKNVNLSEFRGHRGEKFVDFRKLGDIGLNDQRVLTENFRRFIKSFLAASGNGDARALLLKTLR